MCKWTVGTLMFIFKPQYRIYLFHFNAWQFLLRLKDILFKKFITWYIYFVS